MNTESCGMRICWLYNLTTVAMITEEHTINIAAVVRIVRFIHRYTLHQEAPVKDLKKNINPSRISTLNCSKSQGSGGSQSAIKYGPSSLLRLHRIQILTETTLMPFQSSTDFAFDFEDVFFA